MVAVSGGLSKASSILLKPIKLGALQLPNRILMAPLTRCRANPKTLVPNALMAQMYVQRASAGLILAEATAVCPDGVGYRGAPGVWSPAQVEGWRLVTEAVHSAGGRILLQLFHVGRLTDAEGEFAEYYQGGRAVSSSTLACPGHVPLLRPHRPFSTPRALETAEIPKIVEAFRHAAANAKLAGFDGINLHAANGYLIDQFLQDACNQGRDDAYGGSVQNRARLLLEIVDATAAIWGYDRVSVHLAPRGDYQGMGDSDPRALFTHVAKELSTRGLAFVSLREHCAPDSLIAEVKRHFVGPVVGNETMTVADAERLVSAGTMDAAMFGRDYIASPDLVRRVALGAPFNVPRPEHFYQMDPTVAASVGYTDYPRWEELSPTDGEKKEELKEGLSAALLMDSNAERHSIFVTREALDRL